MRVALFISCLTDNFLPQVGEDTVRILRRLGVEVTFPRGQTCCGQPSFNSGYHRDAQDLARHFIEVFEGSEAIVTPAGSCATMVRREYVGLFQHDPRWQRRAAAVAARTYELSEFLVDVLGVEDVGATWPGRVSYHDACHALRSLGVREQPRRLLSRVRGLELVEMSHADWCCGFGGSFAVRMPDISGAMLQEKITRIAAAGAPTVVTTDAGCIMNIGGGLRKLGLPFQVVHLATILSNVEARHG
ncbi:MAG: (Fe-S)-binding protein [Anaerolineae bacterium]